MADDAPIAQLVGAGRRYESAVESVVALAPTTLAVGAGEVVGVSGPSGSGKTTLLHLLGLLLSPTDGTVLVDGLDAGRAGEGQRDAVRRRVVGFVFQEAHLVEHLDVAQNVALWRPSLDRARVDELLAALDVGELAARRPSALSGGQQQRVAVARALASRPRLLIADEPTASLDDESAGLVLDAVAAHAAAGGAAVVATHDPRVLQRATRRLALERGRLAAEGEVAR